MRKAFVHAAWVILIFLWMGGACPAQEPYRIGYAGTMFHALARDRLKAVYERAGLRVEFVLLPQKRSLMLADEGLLDGEAGRIAGLEKHYPNLLRVDVKLIDLIGAAYVSEDWPISSYRRDLLDVARLGAVLGVLWSEKEIGARHWEKVNNYETLFDMLIESRIDIALASKVSADALFQSDKERYGRIRMLEPFVFSAPLYHYVHKRNAHIIPLLEKALRELHAEDCWHEGITASVSAVDGQQP